MDKIKVGQEIDHHRRRLLGAAAMTVASARLAMSGPAAAQPGKAAELPAIKPGTNTSFPSMKQIDAGVLNVGYAEAGPADGPAVILLQRHPQLCRCRPLARVGGLPGDRPLFARLRRRDFSRARRSGTASNRRSPSTPSP